MVVLFEAHVKNTFAMIPIKAHLTKQAILICSDCFATMGQGFFHLGCYAHHHMTEVTTQEETIMKL